MVASDSGKGLWNQLVQDVTVDSTMAKYPKVTKFEQANPGKEAQRAHKRRADERNGPAAHTPISALRKRKGRKKNAENSMCDYEEDSDSTQDSDAGMEAYTRNTNPTGQTHRPTSDPQQHDGEQSHTPRESTRQGQPASPAKHTSTNDPEREGDTYVASNKENVPP